MDVGSLHTWATWAMFPTGLASFIALFTISAPYGRYSKGGRWGPLINSKVAWMIWEMPALVIPVILLLLDPGLASLLENPLSKRTLLSACFVTHYVYRAVIFPLSTRSGKPAPLSVCSLGASFCVWNGFLQGWYLARQLPAESPLTVTSTVGICIWFFGWYNVVKADATLIGLRKPGETGYKIPRGGLFEFVSAANYSAEIFEWTGYAIAAGSLPAVAFAFFTFCNIGPRGWAHHKWYLEKFEDYPRNRKAVIPFIW